MTDLCFDEIYNGLEFFFEKEMVVFCEGVGCDFADWAVTPICPIGHLPLKGGDWLVGECQYKD